MIEPWKISGRTGNQMFQIAYLYAQAKKGLIPDIYVQDFSYFKQFEEDIKKMFGEGIGFLPYVGIHLRRGDYVDNPFYVDLCKTDYYEQAIEMFPGKKFLVFSDDPEFARTKFPDENTFQVMEGGDEIEDLNMLASCESIIIANSSFSWWAAYLCPSLSKIIVAPSSKNWYSDGIERTTCPQEWTRI